MTSVLSALQVVLGFTSGPRMGKRVFLCYRHRDVSFAAGRIADYLSHELGDDSVFRYTDSVGVRFDDIAERVLNSDVLLVIIGDRWLTHDEHGRRRLDDPHDFLRIEIEYAFARNVPVIPVLIEDASLPFPDDLPDTLRPLTRINPARLTDRHFQSEAEDLLSLIRAAQPSPPPAPGSTDKVTADDVVLVWTSWRAPKHDHRHPTGGGVYRVDVLIGAEPPILDRIEKVIYFLPPAWGERSPVAITDRAAAFRLREIAWSDLVIRARVYVRGQPEVVPLSSHVWLLDHGRRI